jgi:hypothetical protein
MVRTALATSPADSELPHALGLTLIRLKRPDVALYFPCVVGLPALEEVK